MEGDLHTRRAGAQVKAVAAGEVVFADWLRGFNLIILITGMDIFPFTGTMSSCCDPPGRVSPAEMQSPVGTGGSSDESGLYFEIRHRGQPVDPLKWVRLR